MLNTTPNGLASRPNTAPERPQIPAPSCARSIGSALRQLLGAYCESFKTQAYRILVTTPFLITTRPSVVLPLPEQRIWICTEQSLPTDL